MRSSMTNNVVLVGPPGFEPGSRTSEAQSLDHASRRPLKILSCSRFYIRILLGGFLEVVNSMNVRTDGVS